MRLLLIAAAALLFAGCTDSAPPGDSIAITQDNVPINSHHIEHVTCGASARIHVEATAGQDGDFATQVRGGGGYIVHASNHAGNQAHDVHEDLAGGAGLWELRVDRTLEHDGTFTVTLTCL